MKNFQVDESEIISEYAFAYAEASMNLPDGEVASILDGPEIVYGKTAHEKALIVVDTKDVSNEDRDELRLNLAEAFYDNGLDLDVRQKLFIVDGVHVLLGDGYPDEFQEELRQNLSMSWQDIETSVDIAGNGRTQIIVDAKYDCVKSEYTGYVEKLIQSMEEDYQEAE